MEQEKNHTIGDHEILIRIKASSLTVQSKNIFETISKMISFQNPSSFLEYINRQFIQIKNNDEIINITANEISGIVERVGRAAESSFKIGDEVIGLCPYDSTFGGSSFTFQNYLHFIQKPTTITHSLAVSILSSGIKAYTALHYHLKLVPGDSILILDDENYDSNICAQIAEQFGAKVILSSKNSQDKLENKRIFVNPKNLNEEIFKVTGGCGLDCILELNPMNSTSLTEIVSCLGLNGRYITSNSKLQIDPPISEALFLKGASISYLFDQSWILSSTQHGRYQHILKEIIDRVISGSLKTKIIGEYPQSKLNEAILKASSDNSGKVIVLY